MCQGHGFKCKISCLDIKKPVLALYSSSFPTQKFLWWLCSHRAECWVVIILSQDFFLFSFLLHFWAMLRSLNKENNTQKWIHQVKSWHSSIHLAILSLNRPKETEWCALQNLESAMKSRESFRFTRKVTLQISRISEYSWRRPGNNVYPAPWTYISRFQRQIQSESLQVCSQDSYMYWISSMGQVWHWCILVLSLSCFLSELHWIHYTFLVSLGINLFIYIGVDGKY